MMILLYIFSTLYVISFLYCFVLIRQDYKNDSFTDPTLLDVFIVVCPLFNTFCMVRDISNKLKVEIDTFDIFEMLDKIDARRFFLLKSNKETQDNDKG